MGKKIISKDLHSQQKKKTNNNKSKKTNQGAKKKTHKKKGYVKQNSSIKGPQKIDKSLTPAKFSKNVIQQKFPSKSSKKKPVEINTNKIIEEEKVRKNLGNKKISGQKKKQEKIQRLFNLEKKQNPKQNQLKSEIQVQKNRFSQLSIFRPQIPERWRESIVRYHELRASQVKDKGDLNLSLNKINSQSYVNFYDPVEIAKNDRSKAQSNDIKIDKTKGIRKSARLQKSRVLFAKDNSNHEPQIIEISSEPYPVESQDRSKIVPFRQDQMHSEYLKFHEELSRSQIEKKLSCKINGNRFDDRFQLQRQSQSQVSQQWRKPNSISDSKYSYEVQMLSSLSQSRHSLKEEKNLHLERKIKLPKLLGQNKNKKLLKKQQHEIEQLSSPSAGPEYTVEKIVSSRTKQGRTLYEIKWVGYRDEQNTLEPIKNLGNVMHMIVNFEKDQKQKYKQLLKESQKNLSQKNRQLSFRNKQIIRNNKKLDQMRTKVQQLTKKLRDYQRQKKNNLKRQDENKIKNQTVVKKQFQINEKTEKPEGRFNKIAEKIKVLLEDYQKERSSTKTDDTQPKGEMDNKKMVSKMKSNKEQQKALDFKPIQQSKNTQNQQRAINQQSLMKLKSNSYDTTRIQSEPISDNYIEVEQRRQLNLNNFQSPKISYQQGVQEDEMLEQLIVEGQKDRFQLCIEKMIRIDDDDHGQINHDLQMVEYSFPFFTHENHSKTQMNRKIYLTDQTIMEENQIQNHSLIQEYDCLKYFCTDQ